MRGRGAGPVLGCAARPFKAEAGMGRQGSGHLALLAATLACGWVWTPSAQSSDKLVYADFEQISRRPRRQRQRRRDAAVRLFGEHATRLPTFRGAPSVDPPGPELVRVKPDDPNRLGKFDLELLTPNQWSGVTLEIKGQPDQDGRSPPKTCSAYKTLLDAGVCHGCRDRSRRSPEPRLAAGRPTGANPQMTFLPNRASTPIASS